ncbi:translation initiation factor 2 subunit 2 [Angomonas deanei]|nr:translation initiation factor 2 subunit 2 [Angomonas deanei]EPY42647.1 translation initiation factor 2 subunit 2 [Angomonas deanei]|eukprot:EPY38499.1 translation initiation factor 2 subunit 2 [Angomonas deanei]
MDFDNLKYEDLCKILAGCTKAQMDEVMSRREQEMQAKIHEEKAARREAFYDNADGYFYSQMLTDIYENLQKRTTAGGQRNKIITPILEKVGKKKTIITNFGKICENFNRSVEDVKSFIESEVSTTSNLNGENALLLKYETRKSTDFDAVIIKYLDKWVKCNACKSTNTVLHKEDRRFEIVCNVCQATRTVTKEGKGTAANIEKRSKRNHTTL